jgi:hypothetical protein
MSPTAYLDTSIILYLTDPPSPNPITHACQQLTQLWWYTRCVPNKAYISDQVIDELEEGDPLRLTMRLKIIEPMTRLRDSNQIQHTAELLVLGGDLKAVAGASPKHIAYATLNRNDIFAYVELPPYRQRQKAADASVPDGSRRPAVAGTCNAF